MAELRKSRPNQELSKLKSWKGGRHSQLRLFIGHLEGAFHESLAAQVSQSSKRKFSEFVPKIVSQDIQTELEYREFRVTWDPPRGLRDFLFYEIQISETENFANFDNFITYDPFFVFPNLLDGRTYYSRVRVVTKNQLFGPWSDNIEVTTPFSQAFGLFDGSQTEAPILSTTFSPIYTRAYNPIGGGTTYYSINYELQTIRNSAPIFVGGIAANNIEWADVEFEWRVNGDKVGENFKVTVYGSVTLIGPTSFDGGDMDLEAITADMGSFGPDPVNDPDDRNSLYIPGPFLFPRTGTFIQKFTSLGTTDETTVELMARLTDDHPTANDWEFDSNTTGVKYAAPAIIRVRNFNIFEVLIN